MGLVCSSTRKKQKSLADEMIRKESNRNHPRILILGNSSSGKTTIARHSQLLSTHNSDNNNLCRFVDCIRCLVLKEAKLLADAFGSIASEIDEFRSDWETTTCARKQLIEANGWGKTCAKAIETIWSRDKVRKFWRNRSRYGICGISQQSGYRFDRIAEISSDNYVPSELDVLSIGVRSTGIEEFEVDLCGEKLVLVDVGGTRAQRLKWKRLFREISVVIFVVSIGDFDECVPEEPEMFQIIESLDLWKGLLKQRSLKHAEFLLVFNKQDVFREKLSRGQGIEKVFPDYFGKAKDFHESVEFIKRKFQSYLNNSANGNNTSPLVVDYIDDESDDLESINLESSFSNSDESNRFPAYNNQRNKQKSPSSKFSKNSFSSYSLNYCPRDVKINLACSLDSNSIIGIFKDIKRILYL